MFSLIISIIAIALVAALAAASVYYGGSAFSKGTAGADASTFINNGQQVNGAFTLASTDGSSAASLADLVSEEYLSQIPSYKGSALALDTSTADDSSATPAFDASYVTATVTSAVCTEILNRSGGSAADLASGTNVLYGCGSTVSNGTVTAYYRVQ